MVHVNLVDDTLSAEAGKLSPKKSFSEYSIIEFKFCVLFKGKTWYVSRSL
jgi:hypothetical protein